MVPLNELEESLWNRSVDHSTYVDAGYQNHLMEQYKIYVEMADRISQRRGTANTFFLTFNTALIGALAGFFKDIPQTAMVAFLLASVLFCLGWALLLRSYRALNTAKFQVIGLLETRLPASPYWSAEWKALGEGKDLRKYIPLSAIETAVPMGFIFIYAYIAVVTFI